MATGRVNFFRAFLSSALGTGLSRVLGAIRDRYIAQLLGASAAADAWTTAWTIPGLMRRFVADEGLSGAVLPALARAEAEEGPEAMRRLATRAFGALLLANFVIVVLGIVFAEQLVYLLAPTWGDDPEKVELATRLSRWCMPFLLMVSLVSYAEALLNYRGHFFVPKIAPGVVSLGIVASVVLLGSAFGEPAMALVVGLLAGGAAHALMMVPALVRYDILPGIGFAAADPRLRHVVGEMGKVVAIGAFGQLNIIVLRQIATALPTGAFTQYFVATRVVDLAQGMVAVAIGSALLPNVTASVTSGDADKVRDDVLGALRLAAFMLLPGAAVLVVYGLPATALWFRTGRFTMADVEATASAVTFMAPFMLGLAAANILKRVFFAYDDRRTLLWVGGGTVLLNGVIGWSLALPFGLDGLAATLSLTTCLQVLVYLVLLHRKVEGGLGLERLTVALGKMVGCLVPVVGVLWVARGWADWSDGLSAWNATVFLGGLSVAAASYLLLAWLVGLQEVTRVTGRLMARFRR